ncbi:hypothetical protein A1O1_03084 [Capronia coronata CBS 617.96]|uniref:BTB domain-containing protein n=1 Tax=Capronia coronata CBS 617.96 TaxID=1182541 RepID=W9YP21_9EURO|nr:uncharacterized protein A1O1_03084 [Capronia coronata CBS 617.96]EXJ94687.1 hypothetical protein A1O1_03084 [Capronia coronata CBS 617.96]
MKRNTFLEQERTDFDMTIECSGRVWKLHRRFAANSLYLRSKFNVANPQPHTTVEIDNINFTSCRMDLYLLWLYTGRFTVLSRWVDELWREDDLEGILEILVLATVTPGEDYLFRQAQQEVAERFATKLWILTDADALDSANKTRHSVDQCLEILFEQETKTHRLDQLREAIMVEIFTKAGQLFPKHKWLETWIGRSPAFKAVFRAVRQQLLEKGHIIRTQIPDDGDTELADARCEEFHDIWLGEEPVQDATFPSPPPSASASGGQDENAPRTKGAKVSFADDAVEQSADDQAPSQPGERDEW